MVYFYQANYDCRIFYEHGITGTEDYTQIEDFGEIMQTSLKKFFEKEKIDKKVWLFSNLWYNNLDLTESGNSHSLQLRRIYVRKSKKFA